MLRSLFAGVSGLKNHQTYLDVIGNNIANVNTIGFKTGRVTFKESLVLQLRGAMGPIEGRGGINPIQIGLGMTIGSIDSVFRQGNLETTGQVTDLAIQGDGFFVVSNGNQKFYTRAGNFILDAEGRLVTPDNGFRVQGYVADTNGEIQEGLGIQDVVLPFGEKIQAKATTEITLTGNLDAGGEALGTILQSDKVYAIEDGTSDVNNLLRRNSSTGDYDTIEGMAPNSTTVTFSDGSNTETYTYVETDTGDSADDFHTLNDLIAEIENDFTNLDLSIDSNGAISVTNNSGSSITIQVESSNSEFSKALAAMNGTVAAGATSNSSHQFSHVATEDDLLVNLRNVAGVSLGLSTGDTITVDGKVGGESVTQGSSTIGSSFSTYGDLAALIENTLNIKNSDGVEIDDEGRLVVNGDGGVINEITDLNVSMGDSDSEFDKIFDDTTGNWFEAQAAEDYTQTTSITVYDSRGESHVVTITFTKDPVEPNKWKWEASVPSPDIIVGGNSGVITFDSEGNLRSFSYDGGVSSFRFLPGGGGANQVSITIDPGTYGTIDGLSQYAGSPNAIADSQDGYTIGELDTITIDDSGVITGIYTNGISKNLAQIVLATFNNATGLRRVGNNMYDVSANSGQAIIGKAGVTINSTITSGALELSNVELAEEFTKMIIAQRGFQANARVTTVSDRILDEVVRLKQ